MSEHSSPPLPPGDPVPPPTPADPEQLLRNTADPITRARLFALLEGELRNIARSIGRKEVGHTLQPTALVNEAWMRLFGKRPRSWQDKAHFLRSASMTMRNILVDHQRRQLKHPQVEYLDGMVQALERSSGSSLLVLEDALEGLAAAHPLYAQYVNLRFYGGCTNDEAANVLTISPRTGHRVWVFARTWLRRRMQP